MIKIKTYFCWYDMWIGAYWDRKLRILYVCLLPTWVIKIQWKISQKYAKEIVDQFDGKIHWKRTYTREQAQQILDDLSTLLKEHGNEI